jgi:hypothetical protein
MGGDVEAIVEVGAVATVVPLPEPVEAADVPGDDDPPVAAEGDGNTIDTGAVELDDDDVVDPAAGDFAAVDDGDPADGLAEAGLELSLGTPLANGLRAIRASTTLTGSAGGVVALVFVWALVAVAAGGAGTVGVVLAEAPFSRNTGTATTATTRIATTVHSLRSTRSRRSELIFTLRWSCRPGWPTGRWWR